jgi:hypothetical protein
MSKSVQNTQSEPIPADRIMWERWQSEPAIWFGRFVKYRDKGSTRAIMDVWKDDPRRGKTTIKPNPAWYQNAKRWRWSERADAYDAEVYRLDLVNRANEKAQWAKLRAGFLQAYASRLSDALEKFTALQNKPKKEGGKDYEYTLSEITNAFTALMREARAEFGEPQEKRQLELMGKDGKPIEFDASLTDEERIKRYLASYGFNIPA